MGVTAFSRIVLAAPRDQPESSHFNGETVPMYGRKSPMRDVVVRLYDLKAKHLVEA